MFVLFDGKLNLLIAGYFLFNIPLQPLAAERDISLLFDSALSRISISTECAVSQEDKKPDHLQNQHKWMDCWFIVRVQWSGALAKGLVCLAGPVQWDCWATGRFDTGLAVGRRWLVEKEGEGDRDGQAHKDCLHPLTSAIDPHDSSATEESPFVGLQGDIQLGNSIKPQGEAEFTLNGKWVHPVTSALFFPHVVISVSLNLSTAFPYVLLIVSWSAPHFCLLAAVKSSDHSYRVRPV